MHIPKNLDEFLDLLDQAIFETRDMLSAIESEGEDGELGEHVGLFQTLETMLTTLHSDIGRGHHVFGGDSLAYSELLTRFRSSIPFTDILETLNQVQRSGF